MNDRNPIEYFPAYCMKNTKTSYIKIERIRTVHSSSSSHMLLKQMTIENLKLSPHIFQEEIMIQVHVERKFFKKIEKMETENGK